MTLICSNQSLFNFALLISFEKPWHTISSNFRLHFCNWKYKQPIKSTSCIYMYSTSAYSFQEQIHAYYTMFNWWKQFIKLFRILQSSHRTQSIHFKRWIHIIHNRCTLSWYMHHRSIAHLQLIELISTCRTEINAVGQFIARLQFTHNCRIYIE